MLNLTKDFHVISKIVRTKTTNQCVEFYYEWKKSAHYQMWKVRAAAARIALFAGNVD